MMHRVQMSLGEIVGGQRVQAPHECTSLAVGCKIIGIGKLTTAYITFDVKLYAQFQPSSESEFVAVVDAYRKTPVRAVETLSVPRRPM